MVLMTLIIPFDNLRPSPPSGLAPSEAEEGTTHSLTHSERPSSLARGRHEIQIVSPKNKEHSRGKTCDRPTDATELTELRTTATVAHKTRHVSSANKADSVSSAEHLEHLHIGVHCIRTG